MDTLLIIIVVAVVVLLAGGGALLAPRRRRLGRRAERQLPPAEGTSTTTSAPPRTGSTAVEPVPEVPPLEPAQTAAPPAAPALEKPPPSAGRLVRLRSRLARSQSAFGSVLLNLLSTGKLDDETWDEVEEVLITADMGAGRRCSS